MSQQEWLQCSLLVDTVQAESLGGLLFDLGALGVEEHPVFEQDAEGPSWAFAKPGETKRPIPPQTRLVVYLPLDLSKEAQEDITTLAVQFGVQRDDIIWSRLRDDGWSTRWQAFFKPLPIGKSILICPTWETPPEDNQRHIIWLDPGMAFGTGHHATTHGCLIALEDLLETHPSPPSVLDVGCGSGILSMAAILLGAPNAVGIDIDADAIEIAKENAEHNKLQDRCQFDTTPIEEISQPYELIVANIQAHILKPMAPILRDALTPSGTLLLSGIWHEFADDLLRTFETHKLFPTRKIEDREWLTVCLQFQTDNNT